MVLDADKQFRQYFAEAGEYLDVLLKLLKKKPKPKVWIFDTKFELFGPPKWGTFLFDWECPPKLQFTVERRLEPHILYAVLDDLCLYIPARKATKPSQRLHRG